MAIGPYARFMLRTGARRYRSRLVVADCPRRYVHNRAPAIGCGPRLPALPDRSLTPPPCWSGLPARTRQRSGFYRDSGSRGRADGSLPALSRSAHLFHLMDGPALIQEQSYETRIRAPWQPSATPTCAMRAKSECFRYSPDSPLTRRHPAGLRSALRRSAPSSEGR